MGSKNVVVVKNPWMIFRDYMRKIERASNTQASIAEGVEHYNNYVESQEKESGCYTLIVEKNNVAFPWVCEQVGDLICAGKPEGLVYNQDGRTLVLKGTTQDEMNQAMANTVRVLKDSQLYSHKNKPTKEFMPIYYTQHDYFLVDRAFVDDLGLPTSGAFVNVYRTNNNGVRELLVCVRAVGRAWGGKADSVGGAASTHSDLVPETGPDAILKEAAEEIGLPVQYCKKIVSRGVIFFRRYAGWQDQPKMPNPLLLRQIGSLHAFDVEVGMDFEPKCQKSEVMAYDWVPVTDLRPILLSNEIKAAAFFMIADFMHAARVLTDEEVQAIGVLRERYDFVLSHAIDDSIKAGKENGFYLDDRANAVPIKSVRYPDYDAPSAE